MVSSSFFLRQVAHTLFTTCLSQSIFHSGPCSLLHQPKIARAGGKTSDSRQVHVLTEHHIPSIIVVVLLHLLFLLPPQSPQIGEHARGVLSFHICIVWTVHVHHDCCQLCWQPCHRCCAVPVPVAASLSFLLRQQISFFSLPSGPRRMFEPNSDK